MKCEHASLLLSKRMDVPLNIAEKTMLKIHLIRCGKCKSLERNLQFLRDGSQFLAHGKVGEIHQPTPNAGTHER